VGGDQTNMMASEDNTSVRVWPGAGSTRIRRWIAGHPYRCIAQETSLATQVQLCFFSRVNTDEVVTQMPSCESLDVLWAQ
jgi:hypothetical protein